MKSAQHNGNKLQHFIVFFELEKHLALSSIYSHRRTNQDITFTLFVILSYEKKLQGNIYIFMNYLYFF